MSESNVSENLEKPDVLMLLTNAFDPDPRVHREALALVENGYHVTILCWDRDNKVPSKENIDGINIERVYVKSTHGRGASQILFLFLFWLKALFKAGFKNFDIVHAHDFDTLPLGFLLTKLKKAKLIYDAHESYVDMLHHIPNLIKWAIYQAENVIIRRTDILITVGEILSNYLGKRGARNICVVGNWQDPEKFSFDFETVQKEKERLGISKGQKVISFIANLGMERQVPQLIEAVKQTPETYLILGGNGPCREIAEHAGKNCPNITYLGYVPSSRVPFYTAISDIVFYGFDPKNPNARFSAPNKLFEGLAAGKVIVTGDFGEIGKIVRETRSGIILKNYSVEEIIRAFSTLSPDVMKQFSGNAQMTGRDKYCWNKASHVLLEQYQNLA